MLFGVQVAHRDPFREAGVRRGSRSVRLIVTSVTAVRFPQQSGNLGRRDREGAGTDLDRIGFAPQQLDGWKGLHADALDCPVAGNTPSHAMGGQRRQNGLRKHHEEHGDSNYARREDPHPAS